MSVLMSFLRGVAMAAPCGGLRARCRVVEGVKRIQERLENQ